MTTVLVSSVEAAKLLNVTVEAVRVMRVKGRLKPVRTRPIIKFSLHDVEQMRIHREKNPRCGGRRAAGVEFVNKEN